MVENNTKKQAGLFRVGGVVSLLLVLVLSVATLGEEEIKNPNVITYLMPYDITTLDPAFSYWSQDQAVIQNVYEALIRYPLGIVDGDGTYETAVFDPRMTHRFDGEEPYKVILTVVDGQGNRASCTNEVKS